MPALAARRRPQKEGEESDTAVAAVPLGAVRSAGGTGDGGFEKQQSFYKVSHLFAVHPCVRGISRKALR